MQPPMSSSMILEVNSLKTIQIVKVFRSRLGLQVLQVRFSSTPGASLASDGWRQ